MKVILSIFFKQLCNLRHIYKIFPGFTIYEKLDQEFNSVENLMSKSKNEWYNNRQSSVMKFCSLTKRVSGICTGVLVISWN